MKLEEECKVQPSFQLDTVVGGDTALEAIRNAPLRTTTRYCIVKSKVLHEEIEELDYGAAGNRISGI